MDSHTGTLCYFASPDMVLVVLPFSFIFYPDNFSICDELEGNHLGLDSNRMKGVLSLSRSHGRREGPHHCGFCKAVFSGLLEASVPMRLALGGFR